MNAITGNLQRGDIYLVVAPHALSRKVMNELAARLALAGSVRVLDGANLFDAYTIARQVRRRTPHLETVLQDLRVARAFTCYQMVALLAAQEALPIPLLAFGLLTTFRDENVRLAERRQALERCLGDLQRLAPHAPVVVNACTENASALTGAGPDEMLNRLVQAASQVWRFETPQTRAQARLF
jgi:hypothetical protein